jgi:four helix bundle protein
MGGWMSDDLRDRLKRFALMVIRLYAEMPSREEARVIGRQFLRSGTSVGAHHREATRARSLAEFVSRMEVGLQELDETDYWIDLSVSAALVPVERAQPVLKECNELLAIFAASIRTAKSRL